MLELVDLDARLDKARYRELLPGLQRRLHELQQVARGAGVPTIVVFEGWDAAGKGTCIRELVSQLDARGVRVHPISAPLEEERLRPFLWRFWIKLPAYGQIAVFDRSWYGRVLVERIDKLVTEEQVQQAFQTIRQFERQLVDDGTVLVKLWLHISKKEQRRRFERCEADPHLAWKIQKEDWRHHKQYKKYLAAVEEMLDQTSTTWAPWTIVEATDKRWAVVKMFETIVNRLADRLAAVAQGEE